MIAVTLPAKAHSLNARQHWAEKARFAKQQRQDVHWLLKGRPVALPCVVTLTRIAPSSGLDPHDNLPGSLKPAVDGVADFLGVDDRDSRVTWRYAQARGAGYAVRVEIEEWTETKR